MRTLPRPVRLSGDSYTSLARTPWAGTRLVERFGKRLPKGGAPRIGESWEFSIGPELPSSTIDGEPLSALVSRDEDWTGPSRARSLGLLVKLLDTDEPLSLQIHPRDDDPLLAPDESGKPEAWYVAAAREDAWIAFGFRASTRREDVLRAIDAKDGSLVALLQRVPARVGDCFVVDAGTPHAIGPGVTLVEPQFVREGKRGVTYRYWDWDRRYDDEGRPSEHGAPRALHLERALAVTDWESAGASLLERSFLRAGAPRRDDALGFELLAGRPTTLAPAEGSLASEWLRVVRVAGSGKRPFFHGESLHALSVLEGSGALVDGRGRALVELAPGASVAIPARHEDLWIEAERLHAIRASVEP